MDIKEKLSSLMDTMLVPDSETGKPINLIQHDCQYCHYPFKTLRNGDRLVRPDSRAKWWGIMSNYYPGKARIIRKIDRCPNCGRKLNV